MHVQAGLRGLQRKKGFDQHAGTREEYKARGDLDHSKNAKASIGATCYAVPPLACAIPCDAVAEGKRGTNASKTAASRASPAPTQSMVESTCRSRARTENLDA